MVRKIDTPTSKKPRKTRTARNAVASASAVPAPIRRPRRVASKVNTIEDTAYAPVQRDKPQRAPTQTAKEGIGHLMARGKDMV